MKFARKRSLIISGATLALAGVVVGTFAVSQNSTVLNNVFEIADYETTFTEEFQAPSNWKTCDTVDKKIYVKNDTDVDIMARVKLDEEWTAANGMGLPLVSNGSGEKMALVNMTNDSGWTLDGTYYYSPTLAPGQTSTSVISSVTLNCDANLDEDYRYGNAQYKLSAKVETIQADRASTEWHKISVLLPMSTIQSKMQTLQSGHSEDLKKFLQADTLKEGLDASNIISYYGENGSNTYAYMWYDADEKTMYWYSDADDVYMTQISSANNGAFSTYEDLSGFLNVNTSRVTSLEGTFYYLNNAVSLHGLEKWDVSNVVTLNDMFWTSSDGHINDLTALSRWDVSNVTNMRYMFNGHDVQDLSPLAGWNVRNVTQFGQMFQRTDVGEGICELADWPADFNAISDIYNMFAAYKKNSSSNPRNPKTDARCLEKWNITYNKAHNMFNGAEQNFIFPASWAQ